MVDPTLQLSTHMKYPKLLYISCSCAVSFLTVKISSLTVSSVLCFPTLPWLQTPLLISPLPRIRFVKLHHFPMLTNGGIWLLISPFHLESSCVQLRPGIRPVHIAVINLPPGVASLSILEIRDLVTFYLWLHMAQLTPKLSAIVHQPTVLMTFFFTNVAERCPVLVLVVQLPPTRLTHAFFSGWRQIKSARPTLVLNSVLGIADDCSNLSQ